MPGKAPSTSQLPDALRSFAERGTSEADLTGGDYEEFVELEKSPPPSPPKAKPKHDPDVLELAREQNFSDDEIAAYTPEQLEYLTARIERRAQHHARSVLGAMESARQVHQSEVRVTPGHPPEAKADDEPTIEWGEREEYDEATGERVKKKLTDADMTPGVVKTLKLLLKKVPGLEKALADLQARDAERTDRTYTDVIDAAFESLGEPYKRLFGEGALDELSADSKEKKRRALVYQAARQAGLSVEKHPSAKRVTKLIQDAARELFGELVDSAAPPRAPRGGYGDETGVPARGSNGALIDPETRKFVSPDSPRGRQLLSENPAEVTDDEGDAARMAAYLRGGTEEPTHRNPGERLGRVAATDAVRDFKLANGYTPGPRLSDEAFEP